MIAGRGRTAPLGTALRNRPIMASKQSQGRDNNNGNPHTGAWRLRIAHARDGRRRAGSRSGVSCGRDEGGAEAGDWSRWVIIFRATPVKCSPIADRTMLPVKACPIQRQNHRLSGLSQFVYAQGPEKWPNEK